MPAGLLFLLLATPFSDNAKAASEEDGAPEEALLSNMGGILLRVLCGLYVTSRINSHDD